MYTSTIPVLLSSLSLATASALPADHPVFRRQVGNNLTASRSPCPALNVLANEGILPNSGLNITAPMFITALTSIYNIDRSFADTLASGAISQLGKPNATSIDLSDLNKHDVIEHDASLTRHDFRQGDNYHVQPLLLAALLTDAGGPKGAYVTVESLAKTRARREAESKSAGAEALSIKATTLAYGETALLLQVLGHLEGSTPKPKNGKWAAPVEAVSTWLGDERLPKGWKPPPTPISVVSSGLVAAEVTAARGGVLGTLAAAASALGGVLTGKTPAPARYH